MLADKLLHIVNGDALENYLNKLNISGDFLVWREMLCEGKTTYQLGTDEFVTHRVDYLKQFDVSTASYKEKFNTALLHTDFNAYDTIVLWFEYDLFCHINLIAALSHLLQHNINIPLYLVCSGRVEGEEHLKGLSELSPEQLQKHYQEKIRLTPEDITLADTLWKIYNSDNHLTFKKYTKASSSFQYLTSCLSAHLRRFPSKSTGLNVLETHILKIIDSEHIKTTHQLIGYILQYQGYYGFGDLQIKNIIHKLARFFTTNGEQLQLTEDGKSIILQTANFYKEVKDGTFFGGTKKYDYQYDLNTRIVYRNE